MKKPKIPKKLAKLPKVSTPNALKRPFKRIKASEDKMTEALAGVPRITNETVAEHREAVLSSARKYIYPLQHSKHRVVRISIALLVTVVIAFFVYCGLSLYRFQSTSGFVYGVTQVVPFPVAKTGSNWVSYENYLFELRRNMHYYQTQQRANFTNKEGKNQLGRLKQQAMQQVIRQSYVQQLASKNHVTVSNQAVDNQIALVRSQNRLGSNERVFKDVLNQFWGWDVNDFKRELRMQLLQQAVVAKLDTATNDRAMAVLKQLHEGKDFAALAAQYSDDINTKGKGGVYPTAISITDRNTAPAIVAEALHLKANEVSQIINTGYSLEIIKVIDTSATAVHAAHIQLNFQPIASFTKPLETSQKPHYYIKLETPKR